MALGEEGDPAVTRAAAQKHSLRNSFESGFTGTREQKRKCEYEDIAKSEPKG